ncbi:MBL fold metallo-hydrolase [Arthrobacter sp. I2-34]|uniref:MBL fold metallo-hydrolase n=1 Tax=Arthrobacter hankyongi TaxID=2904801 RepID=A0ABS9L2U8_9MICC|nr:MBL fold metallo-hydrolase [Arthrobacter hankyongi]MCG2620930.1 MBL fold metallo-hydrolase [Arthrobacter hankyongi]
MDVVVIETPPLGDRSYLVHDGTVALVVDPQRDTDRLEAAVREAGVRLTHIAETHIHNDYLSGGLQLAQAHRAQYLVNAADEVAFDRTPVQDGDVIAVGRLRVRVLATPGHTHTHLSYIVQDGGEQAVFSGGSLLYGSVGRTDLVRPQDTEALARQQYASARRLAAEASPEAALYPTHGFGSFCSSGPATRSASSTVAEQLAGNHVLTDPDQDHFVRELIANLGAYPSYYAHMAPVNRHGAGPADLAVPESLDPAELQRRLRAGEWVVDVRNRVAYASSHLRGSVSFEYGKGTRFTAYVGWVLPWNRPLTLLGSHAEVERAIRDLARIGFESPDASLGAGPGDWAPEAATADYPRVGWDAVPRRPGPAEVLLDVRRTDEYARSHLDGALNIPVHELLPRLDELPPGRLWVHCASGYRASVAASLLQRAGRDVVLIDADYRDIEAAGRPVQFRQNG